MSLGVRGLPAAQRMAALSACASLAGIGAGHAVLETARDALFLARFSAARLPWIYLAMIALAMLGSRLERATRGWTGNGLRMPLLAGAAVTLGFAATLWQQRSGVALIALYLWAGTFATWATARVWARLGEKLDVAEAKSAFGMIAAGGGIGIVMGALLARTLAPVLSPVALVGAAAAWFAATALGPGRILDRLTGEAADAGIRLPAAGHAAAQPAPDASAHKPPAEPSDAGTCAYLRRILALAMLAAAVAVIVDVSFKTTVARTNQGPALARLLATAQLLTGVASLMVQAFVAGPLVRRWGVPGAAAVWPAGLTVVASMGLFGLLPPVAAAFALRGLDGSLRHSLHRTATELLQLPLSARARLNAKPFIDVIGHRAGQAVGATLLLVLGWVQAPTIALDVALVTLSAGTLVVVAGLRRRYVDRFAAMLPILDARPAEPRQEPIASDGDPSPRPLRSVATDATAAGAFDALLTARDGEERARAVAHLARLRRERPELQVDDDVLARAAYLAALDAARALRWRLSLERAGASPGSRLHTAVTRLGRREAQAIALLFDVLALRDPAGDYARLLAALRSPEERARAASREVLQHRLGGLAQSIVLALVERLSDEERLVRLGGQPAAELPSVAQALVEMREAGEDPVPRAWAEWTERGVGRA